MKSILTSLLLLAGTLAGFGAFAQTVGSYKERLSNTSTYAEFDSAFREMIADFHKGTLHFDDRDVADIVSVAQSKSYSNDILPEVYGWAGSMYGNGRMHEAIVYFIESANLYAKKGKHRAESICYFQIALIQHKAENFGEARDFYTKALNGSDSLDHRTKINCWNGLALIKREASQYTEAEKDFRSAYEIAYKENDKAWIAILLGNIGSIHLRIDNYDSALYYYLKNLALIRTTTEFENEIETYINIAKVYLGKNNLRRTFSYLDSAVNIIEGRNIKFSDYFNPMDEIDRLYALAWAHQGDYKKAFDYYSKFHQVSEEKQDRLNGRSLKQLQLSYSYEQKQHELELLQQINQANVSTIKQQQYLEYAFVSIIGLLSILAFVTYQTARQRKKLNLALAKTNTELERLNTMKNKLFSVISHDLRTPLGNLQSILSLYHSGDMNADDVAMVAGRLGQQVKASGYVLENLLEWAKSELHEAKSNPTKVDLHQLADKVLHQFDADLKSKKIAAANEVPNGTTVWADRNQIEIVLRNLTANAVKFTKENGNVKIGATTYSSTVQLMVRDNGVGMTADQVGNLFHSGQVVSTLGTNKEKGSGIGLLITKELVVNNGGTIEAESEQGQGTVFTITLPKE